MMEVLKDRKFKEYDYFSRYAAFPYYYNSIDKKYIYGTTGQISKDIKYQLHVVEKEETLDDIALKYYNNPTFYWAIADFNDIQDPYIDLKEGSSIKVPVLSQVRFEE